MCAALLFWVRPSQDFCKAVWKLRTWVGETKNWRAYCELHFCFGGWVQPSQDFCKAVWKATHLGSMRETRRAYCGAALLFCGGWVQQSQDFYNAVWEATHFW